MDADNTLNKINYIGERVFVKFDRSSEQYPIYALDQNQRTIIMLNKRGKRALMNEVWQCKVKTIDNENKVVTVSPEKLIEVAP